jgi:Zn-dependent peptidase ImmA (M78 family)
MPTESVLAEIPRIHTLNQIVEKKKIWSVSVMALIIRLNKLNILSDWQYRMFCIDATDKGYRTAEPFGLPRETSVVWHKVLTALWTERVTKSDIAVALHLPSGEVENLLFGLTGNAGEPIAVRPPLRLV